MFNIVLLEPEIPANTLNIGRTCVCSNTKLHLIEPLGFQITNKKISRAGLDYWDRLNYKRYSNLDDFMNKNKITRNLNNLWLVTTKGQINFSEVKFKNGDFFWKRIKRNTRRNTMRTQK